MTSADCDQKEMDGEKQVDKNCMCHTIQCRRANTVAMHHFQLSVGRIVIGRDAK